MTLGHCVSPAYAQVGTLSSSGAALFSTETLQLTEDVLANLTNLQLSHIFVFGFPSNSMTDDDVGSKRAAAAAAARSCKTYPGNVLWPSPIVWRVFDLLLGGALIKTVPLASPCYHDYGDYNAAQCVWLAANWANGGQVVQGVEERNKNLSGRIDLQVSRHVPGSVYRCLAPAGTQAWSYSL